jgi:signal transduction histidine kinase/CheY-like chemotaxis protein
MRAGARDIIIKGDLARLCPAIERELEEQKSRVSRLRAERDLERSQEQLRQAQKLEAVGSLAGGIAHDFNNLLTIILSSASMALAGLPEKDPLREDLEAIEEAGQRAAALTRQLLAFGRQQVLEPRVVDLDDALGRMEKLLRRLIGDHIEFKPRLAAERALVHVDPSQLEQVVMNLAVNARDAMPQGGRLALETSQVLLDAAFAAAHVGVRAGPHARISVADSGTGIEAATLARIFEPFFTTKEKGKGTGLGLSTVLGIVQQSGATIWVESTVGVGTTFTVYFPAVTEDGAPVLAAPPSPVGQGGSETILLVEDDPALRTVVLKVLERHGYHVLEAQSAGDAVVLSEQHPGPIHLLLTDVVMPRISGRQLAERLGPARAEMRVLYMSGYTDDEVVRHGVMESRVAFLAKPMTPEVLLAKVRQTLGKDQAVR